MARIPALLAVIVAFGLAALAASAAPKPPSGIKIDPFFGPKLGKVRKGTCKLRGDTFTFSASNKNFSLYVLIHGWKGFGWHYLFTAGSKSGIHVTTNEDSYDTGFTVPGSTTAGVAGEVLFRNKGSTIRVGAADLPNSDFSNFLKIQGAAACAK